MATVGFKGLRSSIFPTFCHVLFFVIVVVVSLLLVELGIATWLMCLFVCLFVCVYVVLCVDGADRRRRGRCHRSVCRRPTRR